MNPTKEQKLEWIEQVIKLIASKRFSFTCNAFNQCSREAFIWYNDVLRLLELDPNSGELFRLKDTNARLIWLAFLHHWVSTGEIE